LANVIDVMFSVVTAVDSEYTPDQHAADIIFIVRGIFSSAAVNVVGVQVFGKGMKATTIRSDQRRALKGKRKPGASD